MRPSSDENLTFNSCRLNSTILIIQPPPPPSHPRPPCTGVSAFIINLLVVRAGAAFMKNDCMYVVCVCVCVVTVFLLWQLEEPFSISTHSSAFSFLHELHRFLTSTVFVFVCVCDPWAGVYEGGSQPPVVLHPPSGCFYVLLTLNGPPLFLSSLRSNCSWMCVLKKTEKWGNTITRPPPPLPKKRKKEPFCGGAVHAGRLFFLLFCSCLFVFFPRGNITTRCEEQGRWSQTFNRCKNPRGFKHTCSAAVPWK